MKTKRTKGALWKDIWRSIAHSKGRFASILLLMMLGSFALVGLFVTGPDMRAAGTAYFGAYDLADLTVISDYGLTSDDVALINDARNTTAIEYGYFKDAQIDGTTTSVRLMSTPERISQVALMDGRMPSASDEIAVDSDLADDYPVGSSISFDEKPDVLSDETVLTTTTFTVVGHITSPEFVSNINMGQSTAGTGSLKGYAVVTDDAFDSDVYMLARLAYEDTQGLDPYSDAYRDAVQAHKDELSGLLANRPQERLDEVRADAQDSIDEGQAQLDDARSQLDDAQAQLSDAERQLDAASSQIADARSQLSSEVTAGYEQLNAAGTQLETASGQLQAAQSQLTAAASQIADGQAKLTDGYAQLSSARSQLEAGRAELASKKEELDRAQASYDEGLAQYNQYWDSVNAAWNSQVTQASWAKLNPLRDQIPAKVAELQARVDADPTDKEAAVQLAVWKGHQVALAGLDELKSSYDQLLAFGEQKDALAAQLAQGRADYEAAAAALAQKQSELEAAEATLAQQQSELDAARAAYDAGNQAYQQSLAEYQAGVEEYRAGISRLQSESASAQAQIDAAQQQLDEGEQEYRENLDAYNEALPDAQAQIADGESQLAEARERLERLALPAYEADTRREALGANAYKTYDTISEIVDSLARVFPVLLYLVAALVTLSTMTRMVDEERINSGTLKALGYSDSDIAKKFVLYGALAGGIGSVLGIAAGHTLMPMIVYAAYGHSFSLPPIALGFYPVISVVALVLAGLSSVLPAWLAVKRELVAKPAQLLLPKPPSGGSKIFLERITPLWNRLSFTHKVTARNLFRYKQRMFMTVLGVAGAVCMLVAGFGVQHSIQQMGTRQFGQLIKYDMIVATTSTATDDQLSEVSDLLAAGDIRASEPIRYESVTRVAGANNDTQDITLIVPDDNATFSSYVELENRETRDPLELPDEGAVISERLSTLTGVGVGDVLEFTAADGTTRFVRVTGVTEMYMGHFVFMSRAAYQGCYGQDFSSNGYLVRLTDGSTSSVESHASAFMQLAGVKSVVQNTTLENQVNTVVASLDKIMTVLIVVASLLAVVIMYNLTNLNVSERMRELSTIKVLGFHTNETTMYIYRETILLTVLGVLAGYGLGVALHEYILFVVPPDEVMFDPALSAIEFAVPAVVVAVITVALYFVVMRRLRTVDMLEALKSVD